MVFLSVHISENDCNPFDAPQGQLLVTPAWNMPQIQQQNIQFSYTFNPYFSQQPYNQPYISGMVPTIPFNGFQYLPMPPQNVIYITPNSQIMQPLYPIPPAPTRQETKIQNESKEKQPNPSS